jgi:hypothetical protein
MQKKQLSKEIRDLLKEFEEFVDCDENGMYTSADAISFLNYKQIDILNEGIALGWREAWANIRALLHPIYRNTRQKPELIKNKCTCKEDEACSNCS